MAVEDEIPDGTIPEVDPWVVAFLFKHFTEGLQVGMTDVEAAQYSIKQLQDYAEETINKRKGLDAFVEGVKGAPLDE